MNNKLELEELRLLKNLIFKLDENKDVFKFSNEIININEKKLIKKLNQEEGENEK